MATVNVKNFKVCAFCKYWYDPCNQHISPKNARMGLWEFDKYAVSQCLLKGVNMQAHSLCSKYICKM